YGDVARSIALDAQGNIFLAGSTSSSDFPMAGSPFQPIWGGQVDAFVTKLSADGSSLIYSTFLGGGGEIDGGDFGQFISVDANGTQLLFENQLGGHMPGPGDENANTEGRGIALDPAGNFYVTGYTRAADFPVTPGAYRTTIQRFEDGFLTKLDPTGRTIIYSTYIPGSGSDYPEDIAVDAAGNAYLTGHTG